MFISRIPSSAGLAATRALGVLKRRGAKGLVVTTIVVACVAGAVTDSAKAIAWGQNGGGYGSGIIACDQVSHQLTFYYTAHAESQLTYIDARYNFGAASTMVVVPTYIQVLSYVRPASGGSWVPMGNDTVLLNSYGEKIVTKLTVYGGQGKYWQAGFYVRVAYPGGQWGSWYWEPAIPKMSLSGVFSGSYGFCLT